MTSLARTFLLVYVQRKLLQITDAFDYPEDK